jgi:hypothetical protein
MGAAEHMPERLDTMQHRTTIMHGGMAGAAQWSMVEGTARARPKPSLIGASRRLHTKELAKSEQN